MRTRCALCMGSVMLVVATLPRPVSACNGPCAEGDIWDAQRVGTELSVVTNFGVVRQTNDGWQLFCEELFGGLLIEAAFEENVQAISTSTGFFKSGADECQWQSASSEASNDWFLDFVVLDETRADAGLGESAVYALLVDRETQEAKVERAVGDGAFETIATFAADSGLRYLEGDASSIYAMGYTYGPRIWNVKRIDRVAPFDVVEELAIEDDAATLDVQLRPIAVDPEALGNVWLRGVTTTGPELLFRLEADTGSLEAVFGLSGEQRIADLAFDGERLLLAGRGATTSTIYVANRSELVFAEHTTLPALLTCLDAADGTWIACNSDFTNASDFLVAESDDDGMNWVPQLSLDDLGTVASCGDVCVTTTSWLHGLYGVGATPLLDAGTLTPGEPEPASKTDAGREPDATRRDSESGGGCVCRLTRQNPTSAHVLATLVAGLFCARRRSRGHS